MENFLEETFKTPPYFAGVAPGVNSAGLQQGTPNLEGLHWTCTHDL